MDRELTAEIMDQPDLEVALHREALAGLSRINFLSQSAATYLAPIAKFARGSNTSDPVRIVDLACGGGDNTMWLDRALRRMGVQAEVHGCDFSEQALEVCREHSERRNSQARFFAWNVVCDGVPEGFDIYTCSLFLHHLVEEEALDLLSSMARHARLVLVNDLIRSRLGLALSHIVPRLLTRSPVVHVDAVRSVRAAYTRAELQSIAERAGLQGARIGWRWPERMLLQWERPAT